MTLFWIILIYLELAWNTICLETLCYKDILKTKEKRECLFSSLYLVFILNEHEFNSEIRFSYYGVSLSLFVFFDSFIFEHEC